MVAGARAQFKGSGTIKGVEGEFAFMLTAIDSQIPGGLGVDKFRIKITGAGAGVVYDNQRNKPDDGSDATELGSGSNLIHKGK